MYTQNDIRNYIIANIDSLIENKTFCGHVVEHMSAYYDGDSFENATGYDQMNAQTRIRKEVKSTHSILSKGKCEGSGELRIQHIEPKYGKFDILKIIDCVSNRIFEIPHDVFFEKANLIGNGEFRWSASYHKADCRQWSNTKFILDYEVVNGLVS